MRFIKPFIRFVLLVILINACANPLIYVEIDTMEDVHFDILKPPLQDINYFPKNLNIAISENTADIVIKMPLNSKEVFMNNYEISTYYLNKQLGEYLKYTFENNNDYINLNFTGENVSTNLKANSLEVKTLNIDLIIREYPGDYNSLKNYKKFEANFLVEVNAVLYDQNLSRYPVSIEKKYDYNKNGDSKELARELTSYTEEVVIMALGDLYKNIYPWWDKTQRSYYSVGHKYFRKATQEMSVNNWDAAVLQWKKAANSQHPGIKKHGLYNLAVGYELTNKIDSALITLNRLQSYNYNIYGIEDYKRLLKYRLDNLEMLDVIFNSL